MSPCRPEDDGRLTGKHFAEDAGVHRHDDVSFDRRLPWAHAAGAAFQVNEPGSRVFAWWKQTVTAQTRPLHARQAVTGPQILQTILEGAQKKMKG